jgi:hypothetical protein
MTLAAHIPSSKKEARLFGSKHYADSKPCRNGHANPVRITNSGLCQVCLRDRNRAKDPEMLKEHRKAALERHAHRMKNDPEYAEHVRERNRKAYAANESLRKSKAERLSKLRKSEDYKAKRRENDKAKYHSKLKNDPSYLAAARKRGSVWAANNKEKCNEKTNLRRAAKYRAAPHWLTRGDRKEMRDVYSHAQVVSATTGVPHEVDHIVPLRGATVSGLHVPWNLQVIPRSTNRRKHNQIEMPA